LETQVRYTLGKAEKLKSRKLIEQVFKQGKSFSNFPFRVVYVFTEDEMMAIGVQAGFSVSTKFFKNATDRNRIKRLMREGYRLQKNELLDAAKKNNKRLAVFFIYTGNELPEYELVFEKTGSALKRLQKITNEAISSNM
jgi:ribonuclease P protein component